MQENMSLKDIEDLHLPPADAFPFSPKLRIRDVNYPQAKGLQSVTKLFRVGNGPSSSHTMGPKKAAVKFKEAHPNAKRVNVTLMGSLAATGKGHLTDSAIIDGLTPIPTTIIWKPEEVHPYHPNCLLFESFDSETKDAPAVDSYVCFSVGGGAIVDENTRGGPPGTKEAEVYFKYNISNMNEVIEWCEQTGRPMHELVLDCEGVEVFEFLQECWRTMQDCIDRGLSKTGILPSTAKLRVKRRAKMVHMRAKRSQARTHFLMAYALACSEENASGGIVVTAPTCGSCGVVPAVLKYCKTHLGCSDQEIVESLAVAGLIGLIVKANASISGAEVGCQGEVGTAASMAAGAIAYLLGSTPQQIEEAAEMGLEHFLGLTCDPVEGMVQIPCIERNAFGATRAMDCADLAGMGDGKHTVSFDEVVLTMKLTGQDIQDTYRETSKGGLSLTFELDQQIADMKTAHKLNAEISKRINTPRKPASASEEKEDQFKPKTLPITAHTQPTVDSSKSSVSEMEEEEQHTMSAFDVILGQKKSVRSDADSDG